MNRHQRRTNAVRTEPSCPDTKGERGSGELDCPNCRKFEVRVVPLVTAAAEVINPALKDGVSTPKTR